MVPESEILLPNETVIGRYNVSIARMVNGKLSATIPPIYVTITQHRAILQPQTRKRHEPAILMGHMITTVERFKSMRSGAVIQLKNGYKINVLVSPNRNQTFVDQLRQLACLPPSKEYVMPLPVDKLTQIISFLELTR